jgi:hypothetical protein
LGAPPFCLSPGDLGVERVQPLFPQGPIPAEPFIDLSKRFWPKPVDAALSLVANLDQASFAQDAKVARYAGPGNRQERGQLTGRGWALCQGIEERQPTVVRQRLHDCLHALECTKPVT